LNRRIDVIEAGAACDFVFERRDDVVANKRRRATGICELHHDGRRADARKCLHHEIPSAECAPEQHQRRKNEDERRTVHDQFGEAH